VRCAASEVRCGLSHSVARQLQVAAPLIVGAALEATESAKTLSISAGPITLTELDHDARTHLGGTEGVHPLTTSDTLSPRLRKFAPRSHHAELLARVESWLVTASASSVRAADILPRFRALCAVNALRDASARLARWAVPAFRTAVLRNLQLKIVFPIPEWREPGTAAADAIGTLWPQWVLFTFG
jgi:hypothetical protein